MVVAQKLERGPMNLIRAGLGLRAHYARARHAELAALWLDGNIRGAVTEAARRIERALRSDPPNQGESREGDFRVMFETPLGVSFRVLPDGRIFLAAGIARNSTHVPSTK